MITRKTKTNSTYQNINKDKKKNNNKTGKNISLAYFLAALFVLSILWCTNIVWAISDILQIQGDAYISGSPITEGNITIIIWNQSTGGTKIYDSLSDFDSEIINGSYDVILGIDRDLSLEYGKLYYMDMSINNQDLDFDGSERKIMQSSVGNITILRMQGNSVGSTQIIDGSIEDIDLAGSISKSKISISSTWQEADIPSLSQSWSGTLHYSKISSANLLNVNNSAYLNGTSLYTLLLNDSNLASRISSVNGSRAGAGNCAAGQAVQNATSTGVQCIDMPEEQSSNPFNQNLNTTDNVQFRNITVQNMTANKVSATYISATNITAVNITATNLLGSLNWSYILNIPLYVRDYTADLAAKLDATDQRYNETSTIISVNNSRAGAGNCAAGQAVQNTSSTGVQCIDLPAGQSGSPSGGWINTSAETNTSLKVNILNNQSIKGFIDISTYSNKASLPATNTIRVSGIQIANRSLLSLTGPLGIDYVLAPSPIDRRIAIITPPGTGTAFTAIGDSGTLTSGTGSTPTMSLNDGLAINIVATAATGSGVSGNTIWSRNFSTFAFMRFRMLENTTLRLFAGLTDQTVATMASNDAATGNYIGIRAGGIYSNWTIVSRNGTALLNYTLPLPFENRSMHELKIWLPNDNDCFIQFDNYSTYTINKARCPGHNTLMRYAISQQNISAGYKNLRVGRIYLEAEK